MKARERLRRIQESKLWTERMMLARDRLPGTSFDAIFSCVLDVLRGTEKGFWDSKQSHFVNGKVNVNGICGDVLAHFGELLGRAIHKGDSDYFRELADAVDEWRKAASIKVLELPGDNVKDASDFFSHGGTAAQLDELAENAPEWREDVGPWAEFVEDGAEMIREELPPVVQIV